MALPLQFQAAMTKKLYRCGNALGAVLMLVVALVSVAPVVHAGAQKATQDATAVKDLRTIATFTARARSYVQMRNRVRKRLPKLSKDSTPEQITAHKKGFEGAVRAARVGAKAGQVFTADAAEYIRRLIRTEFKGPERDEVKETILEADTTGVPLRVNYPYPETKEFSEIPPTLLLKLPNCPKK